ncbi:MAG: hypothetical protein HZA22_11510 [Nitrospirae bacterium]|nr:hypothetical protein [Nitrospirota bacterium]MBI5696227.1 hypothetical protein [Nitrospirota bacterium]
MRKSTLLIVFCIILLLPVSGYSGVTDNAEKLVRKLRHATTKEVAGLIYHYGKEGPRLDDLAMLLELMDSREVILKDDPDYPGYSSANIQVRDFAFVCIVEMTGEHFVSEYRGKEIITYFTIEGIPFRFTFPLFSEDEYKEVHHDIKHWVDGLRQCLDTKGGLSTDDSAMFECLKRYTGETYVQDNDRFWDIIYAAEKKAFDGKNIEDTISFLEICNKETNIAEYEEYKYDIIPTLCIKKPRLFLDALAASRNDTAQNVMSHMLCDVDVEDDKLYIDDALVSKTLSNYWTVDKYRKIMDIYFDESMITCRNHENQ